MADISINKFTSVVKLQGNSASVPSLPPSLEDTPPAVNPPGTGINPSASTFLQLTDTPASYTGQAGLFPKVNSGETGLEFFNPLSLPLTGYTVGSNTALADTDTILGAFGKVQGQINAKIGGTGTTNYIPKFTGVGTIGDSIISESSNEVRINFNSLGTGLAYPKLQLRDIFLGGAYTVGAIISQIAMYSSDISGLGAGDRFTINLLNEANTTGQNNDVTFNVRDTSTELVEVLRLSSRLGVRVGIATTSPTNTLDVNGTARVRSLTESRISFAGANGVLSDDSAFTYASAFKTLLLNDANARFQIRATTPTIAGGAGHITIRSIDPVAVDKGGIISFNADTTSLAGYPVAHIAGKLEAVGTGVYSGYLQFLTTAINGAVTERARITSTGLVGIATTSPTNTLDVNGTARIRTLSNATGDFVTASATGVLQKRTAAEVVSDLGVVTEQAFQTVTTSGTITDLAITSNRILFTGSNVVINGIQGGINGKTIQILFTGSGTLSIGSGGSANNQFNPNSRLIIPSGSSLEAVYQSGAPSYWRVNYGGTTFLNMNQGLSSVQNVQSKIGINSGFYSGVGSLTIAPTTGSSRCIDINDGSGVLTGTWDGSGMITSRGLTISDSYNIIFGTTTGTKIGTATDQKIGFFNATPIVQPSGDILTALANLGLVASPTITQVDQFAVKTTASADQTLPSGTLTILDYDSTLLNNSTATYTVGTDGRITINTTGIYTITAGVVIEAGAVTALESAFLGIFRNGDLVAISSINTTIAAGTQSGLSTSTILSLTATDIIDCRALVNSVGGVANGLARRLGTLLGASATQVNSLSITKNSM